MTHHLSTTGKPGPEEKKPTLPLTIVWVTVSVVFTALLAVAFYVVIDLVRHDLHPVVRWIFQTGLYPRFLRAFRPNPGDGMWLVVLKIWLPLMIIMRLLREFIIRNARGGWQTKRKEALDALLPWLALLIFGIPFVGWFIPALIRDGFMGMFEAGVWPVLEKGVISLEILLGFALIAPDDILILFFEILLGADDVTVTKTCSNCHAIVDINSQKGDRCPHCNAYWSDEKYV